jgi:hypothetical protein
MKKAPFVFFILLIQGINGQSIYGQERVPGREDGIAGILEEALSLAEDYPEKMIDRELGDESVIATDLNTLVKAIQEQQVLI